MRLNDVPESPAHGENYTDLRWNEFREFTQAKVQHLIMSNLHYDSVPYEILCFCIVWFLKTCSVLCLVVVLHSASFNNHHSVGWEIVWSLTARLVMVLIFGLVVSCLTCRLYPHVSCFTLHFLSSLTLRWFVCASRLSPRFADCAPVLNWFIFSFVF